MINIENVQTMFSLKSYFLVMYQMEDDSIQYHLVGVHKKATPEEIKEELVLFGNRNMANLKSLVSVPASYEHIQSLLVHESDANFQTQFLSAIKENKQNIVKIVLVEQQDTDLDVFKNSAVDGSINPSVTSGLLNQRADDVSNMFHSKIAMLKAQRKLKGK